MPIESTDWRKLNRRRGANEDWREVFYIVYRHHRFGSFTLMDALEAAEKFGIRIERESLRVKLARYVKNQILEKYDRGAYKITEKGSIYFKLRESAVAELLADDEEVTCQI